jgi:hypothetical protein
MNPSCTEYKYCNSCSKDIFGKTFGKVKKQELRHLIQILSQTHYGNSYQKGYFEPCTHEIRETICQECGIGALQPGCNRCTYSYERKWIPEIKEKWTTLPHICFSKYKTISLTPEQEHKYNQVMQSIGKNFYK